MRVKTIVLCSASTFMLALGSAPAHAQEQAPPPAPAPTGAGAQTNPAAPDTPPIDAATPPGEDATIVVTGLRRSLQSAENIKRNSDQIVDAIVAEDIGKLPDTYVSDTAARIPGVQVERSGGEAGRVLVRGLPDFTTTYNGREIFTAETRVVALQDFPAGAIGAIEVFKTSTANLVEPGLAGLVNVRSHRPFDFKGGQISGSVWGVYPTESRDFRPNGQLLLTDRWTLPGGGEIGALINFSYSQLHYRDSTRSNTDFVAGGPNGGRYPDIQRVDYGEGVRQRPSINGAIQFRPHPGLEFYVEGLWQGFRNKLSDRELEAALWGGSSYSNIQMRPGTNLIESGTSVNPFRPQGFQGGTYNTTNTYQFAVGGSWDSGPLRLTADLAHTSSKFVGSTESVDYNFASPQTIDFVTNVPGSSGPTFSIRNFDPSLPSNYVYRGFYEENQVAKGSDWQGRLDAELRTGMDALPKLQIGVRYVDRNADRQFGSRYSTTNGGSALSAVPLTYVLSAPGFRGDPDAPYPLQWLAPTYDSIRDNLAQLRTFAGYPAGPPPFDPLQHFHSDEKSIAGYAQVNYAFGPVDGQLGIRLVNTKINVQGTSSDFNGLTPVNVSREYTDWLPNLNARIHFTDKLQLRLAATKTRTRPPFADYNPATTLNLSPQNCPAGGTSTPTQCYLNGSAGNVDVQRLKATNYDASLEYYFSRTGFASVAAFRHDLKGFLESNVVMPTTTINGYYVRLTEPINSGTGHIQGFEAQIQTFFDWEFVPTWARRFGVQANVTNLDAKANFTYAEPAGAAGALVNNTVNRELLGVSKWSYNLVGMYEGGGLSVRLAYNWRSPYWTVYQRRDNGSAASLNLYEEKVRQVSRLDLSTSYDVTHNFTLFFDWTNMLHKPFRSDLYRVQVATGETLVFPRFVRYEESILTGGVRFRF